MGRYFHLADYVLWCGIVLYVVVLWKAVRWRVAGQLASFHFYLLFCLLRTGVLLAVAHWGVPSTYANTYWIMQIVGFMLQCRIVFKLLEIMTNDTRVLIWGALAALAGVLLLDTVILHITGTWMPWLRAMTWCDVLLVSVLFYSLLGDHKWYWPYNGIAWGFVISVTGHLICGLVQQGNPSAWLRASYQLSSLAGVAVWLWTVHKPVHRCWAFSLAK